MLAILGPPITAPTPDEITAEQAATHWGIKRGQASKKLNELVAGGKLTRREAIINGRVGHCWRVA